MPDAPTTPRRKDTQEAEREAKRAAGKRWVVMVGCPRFSRLVSYGLPPGSKPPKSAYGEFACPLCAQLHYADALDRERRADEVCDVELTTPPTWRKRPGTLRRTG
jgi:hypothetical protein